MRAADNPFTPGAGLRPPELAGREAELERFEVLFERLSAGRPTASIVMTGLRGVGKTVLLEEVVRSATEKGWLAIRLEARKDVELRLELAAAAERIIDDLGERTPRLELSTEPGDFQATAVPVANGLFLTRPSRWDL